MSAAVTIIKDEHRSIAAVLHGLRYLVDEIGAGRMPPDFTLFSAMLRYIQEFPDKLHHPKEDDYLYRVLRQRNLAAATLLDELQAEHVLGRELTSDLVHALQDYQRKGREGLDEFDRTLQAYTEFHWSHMRKEEEQTLPLAEKALTAEDWKTIDAAFQSNNDPIIGIDVRREFRELFRHIANLAPPPIGVGPETRSQ
jgi:branched-chain amino acid transport system ATP-binding protein